MAHSKQANKRIRTSEKARQANKGVTSAMRSTVKKMAKAESSEDAQAQMPAVMKRIDKAAKKGILHKNAAARKKSRLQRELNKTAAAK